MDDADGPPDRNQRTPGQVVREYLALRREWETSTTERAMGWKRGELVDPDQFGAPDEGALDRAWSDLRGLREEWCSPAAVARLEPHASFGTASEFNPDDLVVLGIHRVSDQEVKFRTREYPYAEQGVALATEYDYRIHLIDGVWLLDQRSTRGSGAEVIRDLL